MPDQLVPTGAIVKKSLLALMACLLVAGYVITFTPSMHLGQGIQKLEKYAAKGVVRNAHLLQQISGGSSRIIFRWGRVNLLFQLLFPIYLIVFAG